VGKGRSRWADRTVVEEGMEADVAWWRESDAIFQRVYRSEKDPALLGKWERENAWRAGEKIN
jgi:hypothetical protein